jgi:hypothetical protein
MHMMILFPEAASVFPEAAELLGVPPAPASASGNVQTNVVDVHLGSVVVYLTIPKPIYTISDSYF